MKPIKLHQQLSETCSIGVRDVKNVRSWVRLKPIKIHQQLSETCNDSIMDVKNVRSWVRQFREGRTSCENNPKEPRPQKNGSKRLQLCSFIKTTLLLIGRLVFTSFSTTTLKLFLMLRTHLTLHLAIFGCFQHWRTLFVVAHFQVVPLLQQRFSSCQNEPLKKHLLRPCSRGVSFVKNVYVYRVITLRNDCIFSFLWWVVFFKQIRRP